MPSLFDRTKIKRMELKNRFVRSATFEGMADEAGFFSEDIFRLYEKLAAGGVGLIITGMAYVSTDGKVVKMAGIDRDDFIPRYRTLTDFVHKNGAAIAMQIAHTGRQTTKRDIGTQPIAPSAVRDGSNFTLPREMTKDDIERVIDDFAKASLRVKEGGFDAVQLHGAHGYLINEFLNPHTNRRKDRWGGSLPNRMRFVEEIYRRSRRLVGDDFPILIKISAYDHMKRGLKLEETVLHAQMMAEMGFDGIEVSCGIAEDGMSSLRGELPIDLLLDDLGMFRKKKVMRFVMRHFGKKIMRVPPITEAYNRSAARAIKEAVDVPILTVGGITDPAVMEDIIKKGDADYISLSRALIFDPKFPQRIEKGEKKPSGCIHCNHCLFYMPLSPLRCWRGKRIKKKKS
jgi:2,4-dienoyl-CoA reductase-like NADH-dependent reductase (Old Yellow Enzyme family)